MLAATQPFFRSRRPEALLAASIAVALLLSTVPAHGQTTQGLITGQALDSATGKPIVGATVICSNLANESTRNSSTGGLGYYYFPLVSPGVYRVRIEAKDYQAKEVYDLELPVAGRLEINFQLRPLNDVWEQGQYRSVLLPSSHLMITFYGPDVDESKSEYIDGKRGQAGALESTVSHVVDPQQISDLPLAGRDVYNILLTLPGVTSDSATARGLGLTVTGQRPSASNFLLDGIQNNNYLVTGPLVPIAPEAIQEYRVSTNNFSAEYGQTSGFIANAITRAGTSQFHGVGYFYLRNEALNANGFQQNRQGLPRDPAKENQYGFQAGGPLLKQNWFWSSAFERLRSRSRLDPIAFQFPSPSFLAGSGVGKDAQSLLSQFTPPTVTSSASNPLVGSTSLTPPVSVDRWLGLQRVDYQRGPDQVLVRLSVARVSRPDFIWSPYKDFITGLDQNTVSLATNYQRIITPRLFNEAKFGYSSDSLEWHRAHPEIPTLRVQDGTRTAPSTYLPGSPAVYAYRNRNHYLEALDNIAWTQGPHLFTFGGGLLYRTLEGFLTYFKAGEYFFLNASNLRQDTPSSFVAAVSPGTLQQPNYNRSYRENQWSGFAQDIWRLGKRFTLNYGVRFEHYGGPQNTGGAPDAQLQLQEGMKIWQPNALQIVTHSRGSLYRPDNDWAPRFGMSYDPFGNAKTIVRGGYGIFYDHPFDNLWQTIRNNAVSVPFFLASGPTDFLMPVSQAITSLQPTPLDFVSSRTMFDPNFRNGYAQTFFAGVQQRLTDNWSLEVNGTGSLGRRLITTDIVNRDFTTAAGRLDPLIPYDVEYRAPQGSSTYYGLTALTRIRLTRLQTQLSYTFSHSIDNQSEPLSFDEFNLFFTSLTSGDPARVSAFSRQFDNRSDRGSSDFDQRHNVVLFSLWDPPPFWQSSPLRKLFRNYKISGLAAFRSGFPFSVYANARTVPGQGLIEHNRADVVNPALVFEPAVSTVAGGVQLLNPAAFRIAAPSTLGNSGRNAFYGPGLYNFDLSLSRSFGIPWLGESGRFTLRADAFNVLNHANLNNPSSNLGIPSTFGQALVGRQGLASGFPAIFPLNETARQIQMLLRMEW